MIILPSSRSVVSKSSISLTGGLPGLDTRRLHDGLASVSVTWHSGVLPFIIEIGFPAGSGSKDFVAVAGLSGPITAINARWMRLGSWGSSSTLQMADGCAWLEAPKETYDRVELTVQRTGGADVSVGEILVGESIRVSPPSEVSVSSSTPTVRNGDYIQTVGAPRRTVSASWPPAEEPFLAGVIREHGGRTAFVVEGDVFLFGQLGSTVGYDLTTEHVYYQGLSLEIEEVSPPWL